MYSEFFGIEESEQYVFYRVPKLLFTEERFWNLSTDAKMLYGLLLDRMTLSRKNGWIDMEGRVYIIYTVESMMKALGCGNKKVVKLLDELEKKADLILRKKRGQGKPNLIYVKKFTAVGDKPVERHFLECQNDISGSVKTTSQEVSKGHSNNTDINNTEMNETDPILSSVNRRKDNGWEEYQQYYGYFYDELEIDILKMDYPYEREMLDMIVELIVEVVCSKRSVIRIASDDRPKEIVKSRFMKLNSEHIKYVMDCYGKTTTDIKNTRQYLLAALYNAPLTMDAYYGAQVRHDGTWLPMKGDDIF